MIDRDKVPRYFLARNIWVLWKLEEVNGRMSKIPYSANYDGRASSTDPATWSPFDQAVSVFQKRPEEYAGLGIVIPADDPLVFIDLDHCIDPTNGELSELAGEVVDSMVTFTELSQSETGLHLFALVDDKTGLKAVKRPEIEIYFSGRFCACTFNVQRAIEPQNETNAIMNLYHRFRKVSTVDAILPTKPLDLTDEDLLAMAKSARNGRKFEMLWSGKWKELGYPSQSEADMALCDLLAYWTGRDPQRMEELFRHSGLYRKKFENIQYRTRTIEEACRSCTSTFADSKNTMERNERELLLQRF